ncbi:endonuclease I [Rheinheimera sp. A13L]|uniref:endonuclease n=1 Tax=Rheinheimera sp. A13L TaxID=506534 RepID=UPI00021249D4|nr:endonuclease [Rheinheimera sp. A13L]EGM79334.1 endonuclease I [Rheinheimera sp. A13L]
MKQITTLSLLAAAFYCSSSFASLLITEVLYDAPNNDATEEFVELYNNSCTAINLQGYSLQDNGGSFNLSGTVAPRSYFLVAKNTAAMQALYGVTPHLSGLTLAFGNNGDYVRLKNGSTEIDAVGWENGLSGWSINAVDKSISRNKTTDNNLVSDWVVSSNYGNPGSGVFTATCGGGGSEPVINQPTYYAAAAGKTGSELKTALNSILRGHLRLTYSQVWDALSYTDEDVNNTNNVILLYAGRSQAKSFRAGQSNSQDAWNREHVWPKSHGFPSESQYAYTDIHHLRPADVSINSSRGNKDFDLGGTPLTEAPENKTDSDSFEPRNAVKGDVARMMFYMDVRYEGGDETGTPNLILRNYIPASSSTTEMGKLCVLLQWHIQDPVDSFEIRRNNRIYEWQQNRNPFIDNPHWAQSIYGASCGL